MFRDSRAIQLTVLHVDARDLSPYTRRAMNVSRIFARKPRLNLQITTISGLVRLLIGCLMTPTLFMCQNLTREYIRLNGRLIAIENVGAPPTASKRIDAGDPSGSTVAGFQGDGGICTGNSYPGTLSGLAIGNTLPAEADLYRQERWSWVSCTITGLTPSTAFRVKLRFNELYSASCDWRRFHVNINGQQQLTNWDPCAAANGPRRAVDRTFAATSDVNGRIVIELPNGTKDQSKVDAIEVHPDTTPCVSVSISGSSSISANTNNDYAASVSGASSEGRGVTWEVTGVTGTLTALSDTSIRFTPGQVSQPTVATIRALSQQDSRCIAARSITINPSTNNGIYAPIGFIDGPAANSQQSSPFDIWGWAIDNWDNINETSVSQIQVDIDGVPRPSVMRGQAYAAHGHRQDVCNNIAQPAKEGCPWVGWGVTVDPATLPNGTHTITVRITDNDSPAKRVTTLTRTFVTSNLRLTFCHNDAQSADPCSQSIPPIVEVYPGQVRKVGSYVTNTSGTPQNTVQTAWSFQNNSGGYFTYNTDALPVYGENTVNGLWKTVRLSSNAPNYIAAQLVATTQTTPAVTATRDVAFRPFSTSVSVPPNFLSSTGSGSSGTITVNVDYENNPGLEEIHLLIDPRSTRTCLLRYIHAIGKVFLSGDGVTNNAYWAGSIDVNTSGSVQNAQCSLNSVARSTNALSLSRTRITLTFTTAFLPRFGDSQTGDVSPAYSKEKWMFVYALDGSQLADNALDWTYGGTWWLP